MQTNDQLDVKTAESMVAEVRLGAVDRSEVRL